MTGVRSQARVIQLSLAVIAMILAWGFMTFAEARAGGGRSSGSRGSRSFSAPTRPATPSGSTFGQRSTAPPYAVRTDESLSRLSPYGSLWRSIGGGLVGGFLGSMLFRSLGFAGSGVHGSTGGWGGPGVLDLLLIGLIGFVAYQFFFKRSASRSADRYRGEPAYIGDYLRSSPPAPSTALPSAPVHNLDQQVAQLRVLDPDFDPRRFCDDAMDFFFRLQAAWSARALSSLRHCLTDEIAAQIQADIDRLKREGRINRIENIAVRTTELSEVWQEAGQDFATVYFYANCLDYEVEESGNTVVRGSKLEPGKFEEYWTFTRPVGGDIWKLSAITQAA